MINKSLVVIIAIGVLVALVRFKNLVLALGVFRHKLVHTVIVPLSLLTFWVLLSVKEVYRKDGVFLQLTSEHPLRNLLVENFSELTRGQKIQGKFVAQENYLGIVAVRFWNFYRLNDDYVVFRIREASQANWYYYNTHKVDQFQPHGLFPFGFPVISNSAGKMYEFEVESTLGSPGNAVGLSPIHPPFVAKYKYPKQATTASAFNLINFLARKFVNLARSPRYVTSSFVYSLPLILYALYFVSGINKAIQPILDDAIFDKAVNRAEKVDLAFYRAARHIIRHLKNEQVSSRLSQFLVCLGIVLDIFLVRQSDAIVVVLIGLWAILIKTYSLNLKSTYQTALLFFLVSFATWYLGDVNIRFSSERALGWSFMFVVLGTSQMVTELRTT